MVDVNSFLHEQSSDSCGGTDELEHCGIRCGILDKESRVFVSEGERVDLFLPSSMIMVWIW